VTPTLQRVICVASLAAAIFNITVGAAIFVLPAHVAASLGPAEAQEVRGALHRAPRLLPRRCGAVIANYPRGPLRMYHILRYHASLRACNKDSTR